MSVHSNDTGLRERIFSVSGETFESLAIDICHFQYRENPLYRQYCDALHIDIRTVQQLSQIPFLPIGFFKTKTITTTRFTPEAVFESSGTTGQVNSKHHVKDLSLYETSFNKAFRLFYGDLSNYCILGLLPSYLERKNASLVYMVDHWIRSSGHPNSGFYLYDHEKLRDTLLENEQHKQPTILIGVSYALLDFAEKYPMQLRHTIVMETGGMKGRSREITKKALHEILQQRLGLSAIHSEYGMTELLSQAYSPAAGIFETPPWMKIVVRAEDDPFDLLSIPPEKGFATGAVNIIDLANLYSCAFIATDDTAKLFSTGHFEITGRMENSDVRGCGLMVEMSEG